MIMNGVRCQALFSSDRQPSDTPTADMVATAISRAVQQFGAYQSIPTIGWLFLLSVIAAFGQDPANRP